jgi:hypothetical protein
MVYLRRTPIFVERECVCRAGLTRGRQFVRQPHSPDNGELGRLSSSRYRRNGKAPDPYQGVLQEGDEAKPQMIRIYGAKFTLAGCVRLSAVTRALASCDEVANQRMAVSRPSRSARLQYMDIR